MVFHLISYCMPLKLLFLLLLHVFLWLVIFFLAFIQICFHYRLTSHSMRKENNNFWLYNQIAFGCTHLQLWPMPAPKLSATPVWPKRPNEINAIYFRSPRDPIWGRRLKTKRTPNMTTKQRRPCSKSTAP